VFLAHSYKNFHFKKVTKICINICLIFSILCLAYINQLHTTVRDTRWRSWLRDYATSRKDEGSIPDGVILPFSLWPWDRLSILHKWVQGIFPGGKGGRCIVLTTLPHSLAECLNLLESSWFALYFAFTHYSLAVNRLPFAVQVRVQPQASLCGICVGNIGSGMCFSPRT
jgi:hypothetical protein